ncbi:MAG TPA: IS200/IS605 family transposase [Ktedonobacterales bacterium]|nr:IS200/IS605 family transposase [Ktedonobacterales bacterium]
MRGTGTRVALFVHLIWATWDRLPLLVGSFERRVHRALEAKCLELNVELLALGGVEDHIHLLIQLPATLSLAECVKHLKGATSHLATHEIATAQFFKWQGGYAAFSVGIAQLAAVQAYVLRQREHHATGYLTPEWELEPSDKGDQP